MSIRNPRFWFATLITPIILFGIYVLIYLAVIDDPRKKLLESEYVQSVESSLKAVIRLRDNETADILKYAVFTRNKDLAERIRERILRNDQQLFFATYFDIYEGNRNVLVESIGENATEEFERILDSIGQALAEMSLQKFIDHVLGPAPFYDEDLNPTRERFLSAFTDWWKKHAERFRDARPVLSTHLFHEVIPTADYSSEVLFESMLAVDQIMGYFILPTDIEKGIEATFVTEAGTPQREYLDLVNWYRTVVTDVLMLSRFDEANMTPREQRGLIRRVDFATEEIDVGEPEFAMGSTSIDSILPIVLAVLMFFISFGSSMRLIGVMVDEKASKLIDRLIANVPPNHILDGKLWGSASISLTVVGVWSIMIAIFALMSVSRDFALDPVLLESLLQLDIIVNFLLFFVLVYALLGYFFLGLFSMFRQVSTAIGVSPILLLTLASVALIPAIFVPFLPSLTLQNIFCFLPISGPFIMVARSGTLPDWPMYFSIVLFTALSVLGSRAVGGWMFRRGISVEMKVAAK